MDKELSKQTLEQMLQDAEQASALATAAAEEASRSAKQIREMAEQYLADPTLDEAMAAQLQQLCDASNMQAVEAAQVALEAQARAGQVAAALAEHTQLSAATAQNNEDAFVQVGLSKDQYGIITETGKTKYKVRFKILEVVQGWFD